MFEYVRYMAGSNELTRHLWEIVQDNNTTTKEKTNVLSCLMQSYNSRLQTLTSGPESYMNIKKSLSEIDLQRLVESSQAAGINGNYISNQSTARLNSKD